MSQKQERQQVIQELVATRAVGSQEELRQLLVERGWEVTQSTLSRDMHDLQPLYDAILTGDAKTARATTEQALAAGVDPLKLVQDFMVPAMGEVGRRFESNEYFVPELLLAAQHGYAIEYLEIVSWPEWGDLFSDFIARAPGVGEQRKLANPVREILVEHGGGILVEGHAVDCKDRHLPDCVPSYEVREVDRPAL